MKMNRIASLLIAFILFTVSVIPALAADIPSATRDVFSMDTYMTITCYGKDAQIAVDEAEAEIVRLNNLLSVGFADSEISQLNQTGSAVLSDDSAAMIETALHVFETADGTFELTILPMMKLWGFTVPDVTDMANMVEAITERNSEQEASFTVPAQSEIDRALSLVDSNRLTWDPATKTLTLGEGQGIDLGGIAKGYTTDQLAKIFAKHDLVSAIVSLGGNVYCYHTKIDGSEWRVGIQSPYDPTGIVGVIRVSDVCVITSGSYERYFTDSETGKQYHHIIDPKTGYPADSGIISSTIVSQSGTLADTLSTACFIMGLEGTANYWREYGSDFEFILMTTDNQLVISEGLEDTFTSGEYPVYIIRREQ